jgi:hypothetical protein
MSTPQKEVVISLFEDGVSQRWIAEILGVSQSGVSKFLKRFNQREGCENERRSGNRVWQDIIHLKTLFVISVKLCHLSVFTQRKIFLSPRSSVFLRRPLCRSFSQLSRCRFGCLTLVRRDYIQCMAKSESSKCPTKIKNKMMIPISFIFPKIWNKQGDEFYMCVHSGLTRRPIISCLLSELGREVIVRFLILMNCWPSLF